MNELTIRLIRVDFTDEDAIEMDEGQLIVLSKNAADLTFNTVFRFFNIELYSAVWYSPDPMKDDHHEPHLFAKLSTLSGLFRSKSDPSFYMIINR